MILAAIKKQESGVGKQCMEEDDIKRRKDLEAELKQYKKIAEEPTY